MSNYRRDDGPSWLGIFILLAVACVVIPLMIAADILSKSYKNFKMSKEDKGWWFSTAIGVGAGLLLLLTLIIYCVTR